MVVGILVCLVLAGVVSYYASNHPDGLVSVAGEKGFLGSATHHAGDGSPFAGYATRGIDDARLSGGLAGIAGGTVVFLVAGGHFHAVRGRKKDGTDHDTSEATPREQAAPDRGDA
jgi:cobalt/nickel transport system permease protein/cobalt/nickel transport protein